MMDFLTSLASRSFGTAPVAIRPRVASLFEPAPEELASVRRTAGDSNAALFSVETEIESEAPEKRNAESPIPRLSLVRSGPEITPIGEEPPATRVIPLPRRARETRSSFIVERAVESDLSESAATPTTKLAADLRSAHSRDTSATPEVRPAQETNRVTLPPSVIVPPAPPQAPEKNERALVIPPKIPAELRLSDLALSARATPRREKSESHPAVAPPAAEPSVQVTIGRIEVRATSESSRPTRPRPSSPVMRLDEYLRGCADRDRQ